MSNFSLLSSFHSISYSPSSITYTFTFFPLLSSPIKILLLFLFPSSSLKLRSIFSNIANCLSFQATPFFVHTLLKLSPSFSFQILNFPALHYKNVSFTATVPTSNRYAACSASYEAKLQSRIFHINVIRAGLSENWGAF